MAGLAGMKSVFKRWSGSAFTTLSEVITITGPNKTRTAIDDTALNPTGGYRTFLGGLRDAGTMAITMNFTNANYKLLESDYESDASQSYQIVLADTQTSIFDCDALITSFNMSIPLDDKITVDATFKITGQVPLPS